jgi:hypothetical protein
MESALMPSSFVDAIPPIMKALIGLNPHNIIDIGPGWGKYGLLCSEYLPDLERLWAIEVPEGRRPTQDAIYDRVITKDVRQIHPHHIDWSTFDIALMIDVIEHMPLAEGHQVINTIQRGCPLLVSTPKIFTEQHSDTNPYETHQSLWDWPEFIRHGIVDDFSTIDSVIYLLAAR